MSPYNRLARHCDSVFVKFVAIVICYLCPLPLSQSWHRAGTNCPGSYTVTQCTLVRHCSKEYCHTFGWWFYWNDFEITIYTDVLIKSNVIYNRLCCIHTTTNIEISLFKNMTPDRKLLLICNMHNSILTESYCWYVICIIQCFNIDFLSNPGCLLNDVGNTPGSKVGGANMGPIWGRQVPDGPHVGPMNLAIWDYSPPLCQRTYQLQVCSYHKRLATRMSLL